MSEHRFHVRNPVAKKDVSTGKVAICLEVHALDKHPQSPVENGPDMNAYLLDSDSARLLFSQLGEVLDQEQES